MRVTNLILVAVPIIKWVESSERDKGMVEVVDHYEICKVYSNFMNTKFVIEKDGKLSVISEKMINEYENNLLKL